MVRRQGVHWYSPFGRVSITMREHGLSTVRPLIGDAADTAVRHGDSQELLVARSAAG